MPYQRAEVLTTVRPATYRSPRDTAVLGTGKGHALHRYRRAVSDLLLVVASVLVGAGLTATVRDIAIGSGPGGYHGWHPHLMTTGLGVSLLLVRRVATRAG